MDFQILISNITNPTLLLFLLGIIAIIIKSDLQIPESSSKFILLYLLFAIGFKGGQELAHSQYSSEITYTLLFGVLMAVLIPAYTFFILKRRLSASGSGAIAAPEADPGLYIPMAFGITFPVNITIGIPLYFTLVNYFV